MVDVADLLDRFWGMRDADVRLLGGGINSETWQVEHHGSRYVAKRVSPAAVADLVAGCEVAAALAAAGFVTGPPVPTSDGRLVLTEHALALLEFVPGRELDGETDEEQGWIARTLAGVHLAGGPAAGRRWYDDSWRSESLAGSPDEWCSEGIGVGALSGG